MWRERLALIGLKEKEDVEKEDASMSSQVPVCMIKAMDQDSGWRDRSRASLRSVDLGACAYLFL